MNFLHSDSLYGISDHKNKKFLSSSSDFSSYLYVKGVYHKGYLSFCFDSYQQRLWIDIITNKSFRKKRKEDGISTPNFKRLLKNLTKGSIVYFNTYCHRQKGGLDAALGNVFLANYETEIWMLSLLLSALRGLWIKCSFLSSQTTTSANLLSHSRRKHPNNRFIYKTEK